MKPFAIAAITGVLLASAQFATFAADNDASLDTDPSIASEASSVPESSVMESSVASSVAETSPATDNTRQDINPIAERNNEKNPNTGTPNLAIPGAVALLAAATAAITITGKKK